MFFLCARNEHLLFGYFVKDFGGQFINVNAYMHQFENDRYFFIKYF